MQQQTVSHAVRRNIRAKLQFCAGWDAVGKGALQAASKVTAHMPADHA